MGDRMAIWTGIYKNGKLNMNLSNMPIEYLTPEYYRVCIGVKSKEEKC